MQLICLFPNFRLRLRFGVTDFRAAPRHLSVERSVAEVLTHPKYQHGTAYYDVGIAVAGQWKEFIL